MAAERIDVLAVMDECATELYRADVPLAVMDRWRSARDAMAELIDAAGVFMRDEPAPSVNEMIDQYDRVRAALARVQGGQP